MSSRTITHISTAAIIAANDLRSGRTVYFGTDDQWQHNIDKVLVLFDDKDAQIHLSQCEHDPNIIGPYLVKTDAQGQPVHIRERIRTTGPSIDAVNHSFKGVARVSV